jgi:hypothetical protein
LTIYTLITEYSNIITETVCQRALVRLFASLITDVTAHAVSSAYGQRRLADLLTFSNSRSPSCQEGDTGDGAAIKRRLKILNSALTKTNPAQLRT